MRLSRSLVLASLLVLAACTSGGSMLTYTLSYDTEDATRQSELASAAARVLERRLLGLEQEVEAGDVSVKGDTVTVDAGTADAADMLSQQLARPFTLEVMREADDASADINDPRFGSFSHTGITAEHFDWVTPRAVGNGAEATMGLTPEGQEILKKVFADYEGKTIGIFLRGILMSEMTAGEQGGTESITIQGIPNMDTALVFADDVNVGLHVKFEKKN